MTCTCGEALEDSIAMVRDGERFKSCPNCSKQAGPHQFHPEGHFGIRNMGDGRHIIQSWCPECRGGQPPQPAVATCEEMPANLSLF